MVKCEICDGWKETTDFLNELEEKGYNLTMNVLSITQNGDTLFTVFYKYNEAIEKRLTNL